ncbi:type 2 lanthipeptide synthetase LanM family protein [Actinoallomurus sp. NPDC052308]|uniref:type 2 lanthipeptide synthetase LanM family protein n=1 Tax=Actinoallomurus sp. NPDC052308 TaxID=3155530 RepID=UPI00341483D6
MSTDTSAAIGDLTRSLSCLVEPALDGLWKELAAVPGLAESERTAIREGTAAALYETAHRKVARVLILELNAARITGRLTAGDPAARWAEFAEMSSSPHYWESLTRHYPPLPSRMRTVLSGRSAAALALARRLAADRDAPARLLGADPGPLSRVAFGAGDSHRAGHTVALLEFGAGTVVYKPRPVSVDAVLGEMLAEIFRDVPEKARIRVPRVVPGDGYGWAEFVTHRYCADAGELADFYRGIGHWLGVMRLLGGSDLHAENMIACGPVPVVVDCETLFTPVHPIPPSGLGLAPDRARALVGATVLRTGMLPNRGTALGWRGVDASAAGSLPGEQPLTELPVIVDAGSDQARIGTRPVEPAIGASHPSPEPVLADHWERVLDGFTEATEALRSLDRTGALEPLLARFADCPIRVVLRSTEAYTELARMLWHPVSLHDPGPATDRAADLLTSMAEHVPGAPGDPDVVAAEVADLLDGDVPFFATTPRHGRLDGPRGTSYLPEQDLVTAALHRWRTADLRLDTQVIRATLVSAYLNDGWLPGDRRMRADRPRRDDLDRRRRRITAALIRELRDAALRAEDGTVTWIAPVLGPAGWAVQPLGPDTYGGLSGVAVLLAAYRRESAAGRADDVDGVAGLLDDVLRTVRAAEDKDAAVRRAETRLRPPPPGGYIGLGSQIWAWLTLYSWEAAGPDGLDRARALAAVLPEAVAADDGFDLLTGMAGAVVPLLRLAAVTGEEHWTRQAVVIGERLIAGARREAGTLCWPSQRWPGGIGGFAHGVTGIGWALARLALATGGTRFADAARAAFSFEETLYDPAAGGWVDLRDPDEDVFSAAWCHGAVGIGIAAADLARRGWDGADDIVGRAAGLSARRGFDWNHTLCHGDLGCWELFDDALALGRAPAELDRRGLDARIITSLEDNGPASGLARDAYSPGLLAGLGGMAYQLLRLHPDSDLPSVLKPD